jgi:pilus assembly protein CpaC
MRLLPLVAASMVTAMVTMAAEPYPPAGGTKGLVTPSVEASAKTLAAAEIRPPVSNIAAEAEVEETPPPAAGHRQMLAPGTLPPFAGPGGSTMNIRPTGSPIILEIGKGTLLRLPRPAATVFIANPDVADVQVKSPTLVYISAKTTGETVIYAVDDKDEVLLNAPIRVDLDVSRLRQSLRDAMPGERISAESVEGKLVLSGKVSSAGRAERARALAVAIVGDAKANQVVNQMAVVTPNQVNLRVRIAEVQRNALKQLGINWSKMSGNFQFATDNPVTGLADVLGTGVTNTLQGSLHLPGNTDRLTLTLNALAQEGLITTLAEPNLTAMSGQTASFLVGGEFPTPTQVTTAVSGGVPTISIEFKPFGVRLEFTPTIIDANHLNLKLRPEVSQLTTAGAIAIEGISIPALTVTRAETTLELGSGQTFMLAGLLQHNTNQVISKIPGLGDIPVLGQLFRSEQFQRGETELVIIVTPYLVAPVATASVAAPTDGYVMPHDASQALNGDTYRQRLPAPERGPLQGSRGLIGPGGFRLD